MSISWFKTCSYRNFIAEYNSRLTDITNKLNKYNNGNPQSYFESAMSEYYKTLYKIKLQEDLYNWMLSVYPEVKATHTPEEVKKFSNWLNLTSSILQSQEPQPPKKEDFDNYVDEEVIEFYLDNKNLEPLLILFDKNNIPYNINNQTKISILTFEFHTLWVVELDDMSYWKDTEQWIQDASERFEEFYDIDFSYDFWDGVAKESSLYHSTKEENVESILKSGLTPSNETRGLSNKHIGDAVFAVTGEYADDILSYLSAYGDAVIEIDIGKMKKDGYMPEVEQEVNISEANKQLSMAHLIGYDDFDPEYGDDVFHNTIIIYGHIPPKYLRRVL